VTSEPTLVVRKDGSRIAVQAKRSSKNVGVKAVQEAVASKGYYDADSAMVVTNRYYTVQAKELARKNGVSLWDRDKLVRVLLQMDASHASSETTAPIEAATARADVEAT